MSMIDTKLAEFIISQMGQRGGIRLNLKLAHWFESNLDKQGLQEEYEKLVHDEVFTIGNLSKPIDKQDLIEFMTKLDSFLAHSIFVDYDRVLTLEEIVRNESDEDEYYIRWGW